jgi:hypothetical protein
MFYWILVNYKSADLIVNFINSIQEEYIKFIVVDNDGSFSYQGDRNICILNPGKNLGYIGAFQYAIVNQGLLKNKSVVFSNADIELDFRLNELLDSEYGLYIPNIINNEGLRQNPHLSRRLKYSYLLSLYIISSNYILWNIFIKSRSFIRKYISKLFKNIYKNELANEAYTEVYAGHGSFVLFNNLDLTKLSQLKYNFLFGEEIHIAEWARDFSYKIYYKQLCTLRHFEHYSTKILLKKDRMKLYNESYKQILNYYYK